MPEARKNNIESKTNFYENKTTHEKKTQTQFFMVNGENAKNFDTKRKISGAMFLFVSFFLRFKSFTSSLSSSSSSYFLLHTKYTFIQIGVFQLVVYFDRAFFFTILLANAPLKFYKLN